MPGWTSVTVTAAAELEDAIASFLLDHGAPGLQTTDQNGTVQLTAHFAGAAPLAELERFCAQLPELFAGTAVPHISCSRVEEADWAENWREHFPPLEIGRRLFVHPPWVRTIPSGRLGIEIDPGMAFGTGHHATTRGCLCLLEAEMSGRERTRVLDIGTGSGILAIAAVKLGAVEVWAVDTDPESCRIAAENAASNGAGQAIHVVSALATVPGTFDLVLANLFAPQLVEMAGTILALLRPGGVAIGSGVLAAEAPSVREAWHNAGLLPVREHDEEGWTTFAFRRADR